MSRASKLNVLVPARSECKSINKTALALRSISRSKAHIVWNVYAFCRLVSFFLLLPGARNGHLIRGVIVCLFMISGKCYTIMCGAKCRPGERVAVIGSWETKVIGDMNYVCLCICEWSKIISIYVYTIHSRRTTEIKSTAHPRITQAYPHKLGSVAVRICVRRVYIYALHTCKKTQKKVVFIEIICTHSHCTHHTQPGSGRIAHRTYVCKARRRLKMRRGANTLL